MTLKVIHMLHAFSSSSLFSYPVSSPPLSVCDVASSSVNKDRLLIVDISHRVYRSRLKTFFFSKSFPPDSRLSIAQAHVLEFDHSVFDSVTGGGSSLWMIVLD